MFTLLKNSKFKNILLNPGIPCATDEEDTNQHGSTEERLHVVGALDSAEGSFGLGNLGVSKLRARNTQLLGDRDAKYRGKVVKRTDLKEEENDEYDPSLSKYFIDERSSDEDSDDAFSNSLSQTGNTKRKLIKKEVKNIEKKTKSNKFKNKNDNALSALEIPDLDNISKLQKNFAMFADDESEEKMTSDDEDLENDADDNDLVVDCDEEAESGDSYKDEETSSENCVIASDEDDGNSENEDALSVTNAELAGGEPDLKTIKMLDNNNLPETSQKANAVSRQIELYDKLFECRISLQKVCTSSHSLPPPAARRDLLEHESNLTQQLQRGYQAASAAAVVLQHSLINLQDALLKNSPESRSVLNEKSKENASLQDGGESDEYGDGSIRQNGCLVTNKSFRTKRKRMEEENNEHLIEEFDEILSKRHCSIRKYCHRVAAYWDERTKLLQTHTKGGSFAAFDENFSATVERHLSDKDKLLKRTQLRTDLRGNFAAPIGCKVTEQSQVEVDPVFDIPIATNSPYERFDPEIYDDTDFYARYLEELLKSKMQRGRSSISTAEYLSITQGLRKKNKKTVDTRRSKGRKLKYDVISKLISFAAPRGECGMADEAVDQVLQSLFGKSSTTGTR